MTAILEAAALTLSLLVVVFAPGLLCLRLLGLRGLTLWAVAPAWTGGIASVASVALSQLNISWSSASFGLASLTAAAISVVAGRALLGKNLQRRGFSGGNVALPLGRRASLVLAALVTFGAGAIWIPAVSGTPWSNPPQMWDPTYHLSAIWSMVTSGDASPFTAFSRLYGPEAVSLFYPAVFHQLTALVATPETVIPSIKTMLFVICLVWNIGIACVAQVVLPYFKHAPHYAVALAQLVPVFPAYLLLRVPNWPNALGIALIPGILALSLVVYRYTLMTWRDSHRVSGQVASLMVIFLLALGGLAAVYPASFFAIVIMLLVGVVAHAIHATTEASPRRRFAWLSGLGIAVIALLLAPLRLDGVASLFQRNHDIDFSDPLFKLWSMFSLNPAGGGGPALRAIAIGFGLLCLTGIIVAWRSRLRWLVGLWGVLLIIVFATRFPVEPLTTYTAIWYFGVYRTLPFFAIPTILLAVLGAMNAYQAVTRQELSDLVASADFSVTRISLKSATVACSIVILTGAALNAPVRHEYGREMFAPREGELLFMADSSELEMQKRISSIVGDDELVLGDPTNGSALLPAYANVPTVYMQLSFGAISQPSEDARYLAQNFHDIDRDPRICQILNRYQINYFYEDAPRRFNDSWVVTRNPGLYGVDTSDAGFEDLDSSGTTTFYKISACE